MAENGDAGIRKEVQSDSKGQGGWMMMSRKFWVRVGIACIVAAMLGLGELMANFWDVPNTVSRDMWYLGVGVIILAMKERGSG